MCLIDKETEDDYVHGDQVESDENSSDDKLR